MILQARAASGSVDGAAKEKLREIYQHHSDIDLRLRAFWSLQVIGALDEGQLLQALQDDNEYIRGWAVQFLCEDLEVSKKVIEQLEMMASQEPSVIVRLYLAAALQRLPISDRWSVIEGLAQHNDQEDHNIPKMIWFGMEPAISRDINRSLRLAADTKIPLLAEYISRRVIDAGGLNDLLEVAREKTPNQMSLLRGLRAELENRTDLKPSENWNSVYQGLKNNESTSSIAVEIAQLFGNAEAANQLLLVLEDPDAALQARQKAINGLASRAWPGLLPRLPPLIDNPDLSGGGGGACHQGLLVIIMTVI